MTTDTIQTVKANGVEIAYELYGNDTAPTILLIHGLGMPMTAWPIAMVNQLVEKGFRVLRIDNRDQGQSEKFDHLQMPNLIWQFFKLKLGLSVSAPYSLEHMMRDTLGTLDALNIQKVHVVGASMGGMISQLLAIHAPERVASLTSIMSTTGSHKIPGPTPEVSQHLMTKPVIRNEKDVLAYHIKTWELIASPGFPTTNEERKKYVESILDRGVSTDGTTRQLLAIMAAPNRCDALSDLAMPCQVIHGSADPLVRVEGGIDTARVIPNAAQHIIEGMGHDLPVQLHEKICGLITEHVQHAEAALKAVS